MKSSHRSCPSCFLLGGLAIGFGLTYLLDPESGIDRRLDVRRRALEAFVSIRSRLRSKLADVQERITPLRRGAKLSLIAPRAVPDAVLAQRVHAAVARAIAHADSVQVSVRDGRVTIWGPVRLHELELLQRTMHDLPGVRQLELQLTTPAQVAELRQVRAS